MAQTSYTFATLPETIKSEFLKTRVATHVDSHRKATQIFKGGKKGLWDKDAKEQPEVNYKTTAVIWATDNYENLGKNYKFGKPIQDVTVITPRIEKTKEIQKQRTKEKAEVFTPSWVCNLQNNLIDDEAVYPGAFNTIDTTKGIEGQKTWTPNPTPVFNKLNEKEVQKAVAYILSRRLEATCGEAPYLVSRYDTVTGNEIPVTDGSGLYQRIGLLDRKLRIVNEITDNEEDWIALAVEAMKATYGYEWQGDNLLLARLNVFNTFLDYYQAKFGEDKTIQLMETLPQKLETTQNNTENSIDEKTHLLLRVADIVSWNIWQMDGLKMVTPMSCITESKKVEENCSRCAKEGIKNNTDKYNFHNGQITAIRWGDKVITFEDFLIDKDTSSYKIFENKDTLKKAKPIKKPIKPQNSLF